MTDKTSSEYATLPAGTLVKWGAVGATVADMRPLINCKAVGAIGETGGFVDCTTLIDRSKQSVSDLPDGPEKSFGFVDDPTNQDFADLLTAAEQRKTVQIYIELPNTRTATSIVALSGWEMSEISAPASEVIQIVVKGKQNKNTWGTTAAQKAKTKGA